MHSLFDTRSIYQILDKLARDSVIIDIGCRHGYFLKRLTDIGFQNVHGVDNVGQAGDFSFHQVDLNHERLPFADASIDVVNCVQTLHALENPFHAMREIKRVLKPDGLFIFNVININNLQERLNFLISGDISDVKYTGEAVMFFTNAVHHKLFDDFTILRKLYSRGHPLGIPLLRALSSYRGVGKFLNLYKKLSLPRHPWLSTRVLYIVKFHRH